MIQTWSSWKRFPDARCGGRPDAPSGPGVYEVRHCITGRVVAFGHAGDVAAALSELAFDGGVGLLGRWLGRQPFLSRIADYEFRTCAAASRADARLTAQRLMGLRPAAWRRRLDMGWATRRTA